MALPLRILISCIVSVVMMMLSSCSSGDDEALNKPAVEAFGSRQALAQLVGEVIAKSNSLTKESTVRVSDELVLESRVRIDPAAAPPAAPIPELRRSASGILGDLWKTEDELPASLVVTNDGALVYSARGSLWLQSDPENVSELYKSGASSLSLNATGDQLLMQQEASVLIFSGQRFQQLRKLPNPPAGHAMWSTRAGELYFVKEKLNFSAAEKYRIRLSATALNLETGETSTPRWNVELRYSAIGTLPAAGLMWAHLIQYYHIDPTPAPLFVVDDGGMPIAPLTQTQDAADVEPSADSKGNLAWIRTFRRGGNSGRAFFRGSDPDAKPLQLTSRPTWHVALSPDGRYGAYCTTNNDGKFELFRFQSDDIATHEDLFAGNAEADQEFRDGVARVVDHLREVFLHENPGGGLLETEYGNILKSAPKPQEIEHMSDALAEALRSEFNIELTDGPAGLAQLDAFLDQAGAYLTEEPAVLLALAGQQEIHFRAPVDWVLDKDANALSMDDVGFVESDGITATAIAPFAIARERISNGASMHKTLHDLLRDHDGPFYFTENFREAVMQEITRKEIAKAGGMELPKTPTERLNALRAQKTNNNTLNAMILASAGKSSDTALALLASSRIAQSNPTSGQSLRLFATALNDAYYSEEAEKLYRQVILLLPTDVDARFGYADCLAGRDRLEEAEQQYRTIGLLDATGSLAEEIKGRLEMVKSLKEQK